MAFETCLADREVYLNGRLFRIEAPPVGLGLQIIYTIENIESKQDEELLFHALSKLSWKSALAVHDLRLAYKKDRKRFQAGIRTLILQGYEVDISELKKRLKQEKKDDQPFSWRYWIAEYASVFNTNPATIMRETPLPLFLEMMKELAGTKMRNRLETVSGVAGGFGSIGKEKIEEWQKQAYNKQGDKERQPEKTPTDTKSELRREIKYLESL